MKSVVVVVVIVVTPVFVVVVFVIVVPFKLDLLTTRLADDVSLSWTDVIAENVVLIGKTDVVFVVFDVVVNSVVD